MNKKALLAAAIAATLVSAPSFASYISSADLSGYVSVTGYNDGDSGTYTVTLRDLQGSVTTQLPPPGNYDVSLDGSGVLDISPLITPIPLTPNNLEIFSGFIDIFNVVNPNQTFNFSAGVLGQNDVIPFPVPQMTFGVNYDGETSSGVMSFLNVLRAMAGLSPISDPTGSGSISVVGNLFSDGAVLQVTETATNWPGFGGALRQVDEILIPNTQIPLFGAPNSVDANFRVDMTVTAVPEPASLALLGLGLMGLAAARRRRAA